MLCGCQVPAEDEVVLRGRARDFFSDPKARDLAEAAERGDLTRIDRLLSEGVLIDSTGMKGITPLWWAIRTHNKRGFAYLLSRGANPNPDVGVVSVMEMAAGNEDSSYLEIVLPYKPALRRVGPENNHTPLGMALEEGRVKNMKLLIKAGADVNEYDDGCPLVENAAKLARYHQLYVLLKAGAEPTRTEPPESSSHGKNSLAACIEIRLINPDRDAYIWREKVIDLLRSRGIDVVRPALEGPRTVPLKDVADE